MKAKIGDLNNKLPYKTNEFDIVIARDILEHIVNVDLAMNEIKRVLKKEGIFLIDLPNEFDLESRINILLGKGITKKRWFQNSKEWNYPHVRFYTRSGVKELMREKKFEILKDLSFLSSYYGITLLGRLLPQLFCGGIIFIARNTKK